MKPTPDPVPGPPQTSPERPADRAYSMGEEFANAVTHGIGIGLSIAGLTVLLVISAVYGNAWHVVSSAVFGTTLILLFTASTIYHAVLPHRAKHVAKILDHSSIYLLIAGTYTPFTLVTLRGTWGWAMFGTVWGLAAAGIAVESAWVYRPKWVAAAVYVAMGWVVVVAFKPLVANLALPGVWLLVVGGLCYTFGTAFYMVKRVRFMHAVWHLWVLAGAICHFLAVALYVLPGRG